MSDVKRTLKVIGIIGALECLFLQEVSEAREDEAHAMFARPDSVLLAGPSRPEYRHPDRSLSSEPIVHGAASSTSDTFPTRPVASVPVPAANQNQGPVMDAFPKHTQMGELVGKVEKEQGNFQRNREASAVKSEPLTTTLHIFKGKIDTNLRNGELKTPSIDDPNSIKVDVKEGVFKTSLPEGTYTVFIEVKGKLYNNVFDSEGHFSTIEIKKGGRTEANLSDTSEMIF